MISLTCHLAFAVSASLSLTCNLLISFSKRDLRTLSAAHSSLKPLSLACEFTDNYKAGNNITF